MNEYIFTFPQNLDLSLMKKIVTECENDVYFESNEGDRIALKSTLGQFIFFSMFQDLDFLHTESRIRCLGESDCHRLSTVLNIVPE